MTDELESLKKRVAELEAAKPQPIPPKPAHWSPPDYTKNFHVKLDSVIDDKTVRDIARAGAAAAPSSMIPTKAAPSVSVRGNGLQDQVPLKAPPGINHIDRIAEHFAAIDKAEMMKKLRGF